MDVTNPTITHGEVVLLVGGNSGQRGRYVYLSLNIVVIAPISYITWVALRESKFWHNFSSPIILKR
jgi:hypothetical protein